jgi:hypothetical protein
MKRPPTTSAGLTFLPSHSCPVIRDNVSPFLDTGSPEGKHFFVRPFVVAVRHAPCLTLTDQPSGTRLRDRRRGTG